jgi:hypothetical protein
VGNDLRPSISILTICDEKLKLGGIDCSHFVLSIVKALARSSKNASKLLTVIFSFFLTTSTTMLEDDNIIELLNSVEGSSNRAIPHDLCMSFGEISSSSNGGSDSQFEVIKLRAQLADAHMEISRRDDFIRVLKKRIISRSNFLSPSNPSVVPSLRNQPSSESAELKELRCRVKRSHAIITELRARATEDQKLVASLQSARDSHQETSLKYKKKIEQLESMYRSAELQIRHNLNLHESLLKEHTADASKIRSLEIDLRDAINLSSSQNLKVTALKQLCRQLESENNELRRECDRHRNAGLPDCWSTMNPVDGSCSFHCDEKKQNFAGLEAIYERVYGQKLRAN